MKYSFTFLSVLVLACNKPFITAAVYVKEPPLEPKSSYLTNQFNESFFNENHFSYKEGVQQDGNGSFNYILPDGKIDNTLLDTIKHYYTAETVILSKEQRFYLRKAKTYLSNDTLILNLDDAPFSSSWYALAITKISKQLYFKCDENTIIIGDSSYQSPQFSTIEQHLILDKASYQKGDTLKAKFTAKIAALHTWSVVYSDTLNFYGFVKTLVE